MSTGNCVVRNKRYKKIPPDGGWGYMICVAAIINNCATSMFLGSFGIIYKEFMEQQKITSKTVTLLTGINFMLAAFSGFLTSHLLKYLSIRMAALIASCLFNIGILCTVFVNTTPLFFLCQGVQYIGLGILYTTSSISVNDYFLEKRLLAVSLAQTCTAGAAMLAPELVAICLRMLGYRETLMVISAISLHTFIGVALLQPVSRHMVKVELEGVADEMVLLVGEKPTPDLPVTTPTITLTDTDSPFEVDVKKGTEKGTNNFCSEIFDVLVLKKFTQAAHAISLVAFGDLITRAMFVLTSKWLTKLGHQEVYIAFVFLAFLSRIMLLWTESTTAMMVFATMIGIARCGHFLLPPLILADYFGSEHFPKALGLYLLVTGIMTMTLGPAVEHFPKALGLYLLVTGIMTMTLGPAIGAIRDLTSYSTAFYVITCCYPIVVLFWIMELIYKRNKHKRVAQKSAQKMRKKSLMK
ncbi:major facilitator superfamily domain-containing protein [Phthorimaea operculella]|nr:major facilitator superfamily domain-containing protein [Phthorimaea operculella]